MEILAYWNESISIEWWKMLLIGLFFCVVNTGIFMATWYMKEGSICEYGYPKRKMRTIRKQLKSYTFWERLFLCHLVKDVTHKGAFLYLKLIDHFICMGCLFASFIGFVGCMATLADGWAFILLVAPEINALFITGLIEFVPDLICLPSERKRYKL